MFEPTREQDHAAEAMAEKYGRCMVRPQDDGSVILVGIAGADYHAGADELVVEMEYRRVAPDGTATSAEHERKPPSPVVVQTTQGKRGRMVS